MELGLMIVGLILIFIAIVNVNKYNKVLAKTSEDIYKIHNDVKEYYFMIQDILLKIESLIDITIETVEETKLDQDHGKYVSEENLGVEKVILKSNNVVSEDDSDTEITEEHKIIEMYKAGMSIQDIAKYFKKGIRETEFIIKFQLKDIK